MITLILTTLLSFLYAFLEGRREAQYFHFKYPGFSLPNRVKVRDEHLEFTIQRFLYVLSCTLVILFHLNIWYALTQFLIICFSFSYFHNGSYYLRRNQLRQEIYDKKWKDQSISTTARFSFNYKTRLIMFLFSLLLLTVSVICLI